MKTMSVSEAKTRFGSLMDQVQKEPVTIEKRGCPVAVVISFVGYQEQYANAPSQQEKEQALAFLERWSKRPAVTSAEEVFKVGVRAKTNNDKYIQMNKQHE